MLLIKSKLLKVFSELLNIFVIFFFLESRTSKTKQILLRQ